MMGNCSRPRIFFQRFSASISSFKAIASAICGLPLPSVAFVLSLTVAKADSIRLVVIICRSGLLRLTIARFNSNYLLLPFSGYANNYEQAEFLIFANTDLYVNAIGP